MKLFLRHRYVDSPPRDLSDNANDGVAQDLTGGVGAVDGAAGFNGTTSWIHVPVSPSMQNLGQVQVRAVFRLDPTAPPARLNLVEGFTSFALMIDPSRSLSFTIVDRNEQWVGCSSPPGVVTPGTWYTVNAGHDGVSEARIALNEAVVASANGVMGPVRSVGNLGVAIGRWPDAPQYQFKGHLSEVALYKFDPIPAIDCVFGAACVDRGAVAKMLTAMVKRMGDEEALQWARDLQDVILQIMQIVQAGQSDIDTFRGQMGTATLAIARRDGRAFRAALGRYREHTDPIVASPHYRDLCKRFTDLVHKMALDKNQVDELVRALCLDRLSGDRR